MKLSTLFTVATLSAGLWFSVAAFAQNAQTATLPQKAAAAQQNQAKHPSAHKRTLPNPQTCI